MGVPGLFQYLKSKLTHCKVEIPCNATIVVDGLSFCHFIRNKSWVCSAPLHFSPPQKINEEYFSFQSFIDNAKRFFTHFLDLKAELLVVFDGAFEVSHFLMLSFLILQPIKFFTRKKRRMERQHALNQLSMLTQCRSCSLARQ